MFSYFNRLNEGGYTDLPKGGRKKEFHEGINPRIPSSKSQLTGWAKDKDLMHKNKRWEQLR